MRLWAISDLHVSQSQNREALLATPAHPDDALILAGDLAESEADLRFVFETLRPRFRRMIWVPGNHELWTMPNSTSRLRGEEKYAAMVAAAREFEVLTPEDQYECWTIDGREFWVCPMFLLYDYSYRPAHVSEENALAWAAEEDIVCADEYLLHPDPHAGRAEWCRARCAETERRLEKLPRATPKILINHFPLRADLAHTPAIPRFSLWCGTKITEDWHRRFNAELVVSGHLHLRTTQWRDGVRFEEVSLGYPKQWRLDGGVERYLRQVMPALSDESEGLRWYR